MEGTSAPSNTHRPLLGWAQRMQAARAANLAAAEHTDNVDGEGYTETGPHGRQTVNDWVTANKKAASRRITDKYAANMAARLAAGHSLPIPTAETAARKGGPLQSVARGTLGRGRGQLAAAIVPGASVPTGRVPVAGRGAGRGAGVIAPQSADDKRPAIL